MSGSDKGGGVSHHTPPSEESLGGQPRKPQCLLTGKIEQSQALRRLMDLADGQLEWAFGRIRPNVPGIGWILFDGRTQCWQGLTLTGKATGLYSHVEPCLAALRRLAARAPAPPAADRAESAPAPTGSRRASR